MADEDLSLPDDVFVPILLHLPTSSRRRFRLVCKRWRDVIDERTPEMQVGTKILAFVSQHHRGSRAIVFDKEDGCRRHAWIFPCSHERSTTAVSMVGTCNGLLCLHERVVAPGKRSFSIVTVTNPITGETMALPPPPESLEPEQERAHAGKYSFGYHPTTGKYKVVRIPCGRRRQGAVHAVQVFTLGGGGDTASWREVPVTTSPGGGAICSPLSDAVSIDGRTYWLDASAASRVMALDLADEQVTSFAAPPPPACPGLLPAAGAGWELTSVHGRLGAVATTAVGRVDVWVLDDSGGGGAWPRWSRRYEIVEATPTTSDYWIVAPELTHGEYILRSSRDRMTRDDYAVWGYTYGRRRLYRHKVGDLTGDGDGEDDGQWPAVEGWELLMSAEESHGDLTTFAYVDTLEPLPRSETHG
ncbi:unnamed protein product [Urochloa decumbens]|uniref:F-box domain-containing protein n=1 Tax=Urochloa decumbens TaxID=240449 RepID=A0ABC9C2N7_9POAL